MVGMMEMWIYLVVMMNGSWVIMTVRLLLRGKWMGDVYTLDNLLVV